MGVSKGLIGLHVCIIQSENTLKKNRILTLLKIKCFHLRIFPYPRFGIELTVLMFGSCVVRHLHKLKII